MSSIFSMSSILPSSHPNSLGGNTKSYQSVGGKKNRKSKKGNKKRKHFMNVLMHNNLE